VLKFNDKYEIILNLMEATRLRKVGTEATKGWKSKEKQLEEHVGAN